MLKRLYKRFIHFIITVIAAIFVLYCTICIVYPLEHYELIEKYSKQYGLDPAMVCALIQAESGFNADATSPKGAKGLMQLMDDTASWIAPQIPIENFNVFRIKEPELNIQLGCWYLGYLNKRFDGDLTLMVAAYNAGSGNIDKWLDNEKYSADGKTLDKIPYTETKKYVRKIKINQYVYRLLLKVKFYENETIF